MSVQDDIETYVRLRSVEEGDCLLWQGMVTHSGHPAMRNKKQSKASVRRALFEHLSGKPIPEGRQVVNTCGEKLCLKGEHLRLVTIAQVRALAAKRGAYKSAARALKRTVTLRQRSTISEETVQVVRDAATAKEAQLATGLSLAYVYEIRAGVRRAPLANPFAGLMAA